MVEHVSTQAIQHQPSFNGAQRQRWYYHYHHSELETPGVTNRSTTNNNHRFSIFNWFKRRDSSSATDNTIRHIFQRSKRRPSGSSTSSSKETFYSTATVRSFSFKSGNRQDIERSTLPLTYSSGAVGPFAPGAVKLIEKPNENKLQSVNATTTYTLPSVFSERKDILSRYSLHPVNGIFISHDSIPIVDRKPGTFSEVRKNINNNKTATTVLLTSYSSSSSTKKLHVKGKRRAPDPPFQYAASIHVAGTNSCSKPIIRGKRKRKPAPKPPGYIETLSSNQNTLSLKRAVDFDTLLISKDCQTISNDTLVIRKGVLLPKNRVQYSNISKISSVPVYNNDDNATSDGQVIINKENRSKFSTIMPRLWYKRHVFKEHSSGGSKNFYTNANKGAGDLLRGILSPLSTDENDKKVSSIVNRSITSTTLYSSFLPQESCSKRDFFYCSDPNPYNKKKMENCRKSCASILTNISELDKEAAAIVQKEQGQNRASTILQVAKVDENVLYKAKVKNTIVHEILNSTIENSSLRSTRALISKFNAIGNITKVTSDSSLFNKSNKRFSQKCYNNRDNKIDGKIERNLSNYFIPYQSLSKKKSSTIFSKNIESSLTNALIIDTTQSMTPLERKIITTPTINTSKMEKNNNMDYIKTVTAELHNVATGIAHLERELDYKPKIIDNHNSKQEKSKQQNKLMLEKKLNMTKNNEIGNFEKEFTKIFSKIDKQFKKTKNTAISTEKSDLTTIKKDSISNKVTKFIDILVTAEKHLVDQKNVSLSMNDRNFINVPLVVHKKEIKGKETSNAVKISSFNDSTQIQLKELLKEMKYSLPKRQKKKNSLENQRKIKDYNILAESSSKKSLTRSSLIVEEIAAIPKISNKVSSSVQTSGNVCKIINEVPPTKNCRVSGPAAVQERNTNNDLSINYSQPIEQNLLLETHQKKIYTNVIDRYMYPNPQYTSSVDITEKNLCGFNSEIDKYEAGSNVTKLSVLTHKEKRKFLQIEMSENNQEGQNLDENKKHYINTLAVNQLLRKLEAAIASGHHLLAARLAKELAQLKIHCSVIRQRSCKPKKKINLKMFIEDKQAHQGPIPLQLPLGTTVAQLKDKIQIEFEIPSKIQRWIIGKKLANNDKLTLNELKAVEGSQIFLYIVGPDIQDKKMNKIKNVQNTGQEKVKIETTYKLKKESFDQVGKIGVEIQLETKSGNEYKSDISLNIKPRSPENKEESSTTQDKLQSYQELMLLENYDIISNIEPIECPVCFMVFSPGEGITLRDCLHTFCRLCVVNTVRYCEEAEVKCPYRDMNYTCESTLQEREIKALVDPEVYLQHLAKSITQAENNAGNNAFHCKTPNCVGWCIYDDNVNNFLCPVCKLKNCLTCQAMHIGMNCDQYQEQLKYLTETDRESKRTTVMLEEMLERGEALSCPTCAIILMKKWGCDWLRCSMCKTEICWITRGPRWGPGGKGDTSGGCRCGENGVKCHPRCNYCH